LAIQVNASFRLSHSGVAANPTVESRTIVKDSIRREVFSESEMIRRELSIGLDSTCVWTYPTLSAMA